MAQRSNTFWLIVLLLVLASGAGIWGFASFPRAVTSSTSVTTSPTESSTTTAANSDFGACADDISFYCAGFNTGDWEAFATENGYTIASWKLGLVDCIGEHIDDVSEACRESQDRRAALNEDVNTICADDRNTYCKGVVPKPGSEPQIDCLKENYCELTPACVEALDNHEYAKLSSQQDFSYQQCQ